MGGSYNNYRRKRKSKFIQQQDNFHVNTLSCASALAAKRACIQLSLDPLPCQMASTTSGSALDEIFADKEMFEAHFGFSCEEGVLDSDESDLEVDLSDAEGDSYSGK